MSENRLSPLIKILKQLEQYPKSKANFVRVFNRATGCEFGDRIVSEIVKGKRKFERGEWKDYLPIAIEAAEQVLIKYQRLAANEEKRKMQKILSKSLFNFDYSFQFIEETILRSDSLFEKGDVATSIQEIKSLNGLINFNQIQGSNKYLYGYFHLVFAKIQMQLGISQGKLGSLNLVQHSINSFNGLNSEKERLFQAINLQGHIFRQINSFDYALKSFTQAQELLESTSKGSRAKQQNTAMYINHQNAVTLMRKAVVQEQDGLLDEAARLMSTSNDFLRNGHDEEWYKFSSLREAEIYVKSNNLAKAEPILQRFEDSCETALMSRARKVIFFRINAERYLMQGNHLDALRYFKVAVELSVQDGYTYELKLLERLYCDYRLLKRQLPPNFSVYQPKWV